jgi:hypothetical protein
VDQWIAEGLPFCLCPTVLFCILLNVFFQRLSADSTYLAFRIVVDNGGYLRVPSDVLLTRVPVKGVIPLESPSSKDMWVNHTWSLAGSQARFLDRECCDEGEGNRYGGISTDAIRRADLYEIPLKVVPISKASRRRRVSPAYFFRSGKDMLQFEMKEVMSTTGALSGPL